MRSFVDEPGSLMAMNASTALFALLLGAWLFLRAAPVAAQWTPTSGLNDVLRVGVAASSPQNANARRPHAMLETWPARDLRQRRARLLIATGLGLVTGAAIHAAIWAPRYVCRDSSLGRFRTPVPGAGVGATIGLGITVGGSAWLVRSDHPRASIQRDWLAGFGYALLSAAAIQVPLSYMVGYEVLKQGLCSS